MNIIMMYVLDVECMLTLFTRPVQTYIWTNSNRYFNKPIVFERNVIRYSYTPKHIYIPLLLHHKTQ